MKINNEKKKNWTPFAPNLGDVLVPLAGLAPYKFGT